MAEPPQKFDPHQPDMPQIPGVGGARRESSPDLAHVAKIGLPILAAVVVIAGIAWWAARGRRHTQEGAESAGAVVPAPSQAETAPTAPVAAAEVNQAATVEELSKPWSAKKFTFVKPGSNEQTDAMVMKLPDGQLWAFSLQEPFGTCTLQFMTDPEQISRTYSYPATHPMIVSPCTRTLYDPLKVDTVSTGAWVRGEVVQGTGLRPPIAIEVTVQGRFIVADRIE